MLLINTSALFKFYYTYYSGSETRSSAFITSSSSVSGINPLSEVEKFLVRKRTKCFPGEKTSLKNTNTTYSYL